MSAGPIAILIDGAYFLKRLPRLVAPKHCDTPQDIVNWLRIMCRNHVTSLRHIPNAERKTWHQHVYRIFYYDAVPYQGKAHHPILNRQIDYQKSDIAAQRNAIFELLREQRKLALRLGKISRDTDWSIASKWTKTALKSRQWAEALNALPSAEQLGTADETLTLNPLQVRELTQLRDFWANLDSSAVNPGFRQKGVDMRIGVDIASITLKKLANTIVLVSGDSDFVPAAKLARREGMEFILDPLWQSVNNDLFEHIDGLQSGLNRPTKPYPGTTTPAPEGN
jgi:uncharacterized LabA/DUF88 family protein